MITPQNVMAHLWNYLPSVTSLFNEPLTMTGASVTAGVITGTIATSTPTLNQNVLISGIKVRNPITAYLDNGDGTARFTTANDHQLTEPRQRLDDQQLELGGITPSAWNGLHNILAVPNRRTFEIAIPSGATIPTVAGYLIESPTGVMGIGKVTAVTGTTVSITPDDGIFHYNAVIHQITVNRGIRVRAAADIDRAQAIYAKQTGTNPFAFVIFTDVAVSKDRHTPNDAIATFTKQDMRLLVLLQNFSIAVFFPAQNDIGGDKAQHMAYGEVYKALTKLFYGFGFDDPDSAVKYVTVSAGHGPGIYNTGFYLHVYDWQVPNVITYDQGFDGQSDFITDVAFRDIEQDLFVNNSEQAIMSFIADLDEEPLP